MQKLLTKLMNNTNSANGLKTLLDNANKHLRALSVLYQPVEDWDVIIVDIVFTRLPIEIKKSQVCFVHKYAYMERNTNVS